ncbi:MAG: hypothetical protein Q8L47_04905 [bacterium]|nr:hypothetical protein [bacterium]
MGWISQTIYKGLLTLRSAEELPQGYAADSLNADLASSSSATPLKGYSLFGNQANPNDKIVAKFSYFRGEDTEVLLQVRDDATNYIVEYLNTEDIRNSANGEWLILESGLSRVLTLLDGTTIPAFFTFAPFNDSSIDGSGNLTITRQLLYGNGVESIRIWNGSTAKVASSTTNTIVIAGTQTCAQRGFSATGSVNINGTNYVYTGLSSKTFTGVTTDASGLTVGIGIAQKVDSTTLGSIDKAAIIGSSQSRIFLLDNTTCSFSNVSDATTWTAGSTLSAGGFEDFPQLNGPGTAMSFLDDWVIVFSKVKIIAFRYTFPSSTTRVSEMKEISDEGTSNPKSIIKVGNQIIYITPKGGIKRLTAVQSENVFNVEDLTESIRPSIKNWIWDDGCLLYSPKDRILIAAGQSNDTVGVNDKAVTLQFSIDENGNQIINLGIIDWFINAGAFYNGKLHFGSSVESNNFIAFDGWSKNGAPYNFKRTERIENFGNHWEKKWLKFLAVSGGLANGSTLKIKIKYGLNGSITTKEMQIKASDSNYVIQSPLNVLGGFELGTQPLGSTNEDLGDQNPFEVIFELEHIYSRIIQVEFYTEGVGQNVSIFSHGYYVENAEQHITADEIASLGVS